MAKVGYSYGGYGDSGYGDGGYGDGDGSGYGGYADGDGSGYGGYGYDGYGGYGYGDGDGSGYGGSGYDGDGSGYGGSGYGYGDGDGSGYGGSGYGGSGYDGSGYGYGDLAEYWSTGIACAHHDIPAVGEALEAGAVIAYWRSDESGQPCNGGSRLATFVGVIHTAPGPLALCEPGTLHASFSPSTWKGIRLWLVAMYPPCIVDGMKVGSLRREILAEIFD